MESQSRTTKYISSQIVVAIAKKQKQRIKTENKSQNPKLKKSKAKKITKKTTHIHTRFAGDESIHSVSGIANDITDAITALVMSKWFSLSMYLKMESDESGWC
jgi:hypothetical protein